MTVKQRLVCLVLVLGHVSVITCLGVDLVITEIMANPSGADSQFEWIEVYNPTASPVVMDDYRLRESDTMHHLQDITISPFGFVIIARDKVKFLERYPAFSTNTIDSVFSLSNSGETLELMKGSTYPDDVVDEVVFDLDDSPTVVSGLSMHLNLSMKPTTATENDAPQSWRTASLSDGVSTAHGTDVANPGTSTWSPKPEKNPGGMVIIIR